jgi:hypothetical protein
VEAASPSEFATVSTNSCCPGATASARTAASFSAVISRNVTVCAIRVGYAHGEIRPEETRMASRFTELSVDAHDTRGQAEFWCEVLGYRIIDEKDSVVEIAAAEPIAEEVVRAPVPPTIVFAPVPEDKSVKNRLHIDVSPIDREPDAEVERMIALGARRVDIGQGDVPWTVLADPEGNEFCVLRRLGPVESP